MYAPRYAKDECTHACMHYEVFLRRADTPTQVAPFGKKPGEKAGPLLDLDAAYEAILNLLRLHASTFLSTEEPHKDDPTLISWENWYKAHPRTAERVSLDQKPRWCVPAKFGQNKVELPISLGERAREYSESIRCAMA